MDIISGTSDKASGALQEERKTQEARAKAFRLQKIIEDSGEAIEIDVQHYFAPGLYARPMFMPKGSTIIGKIHKYHQINICCMGDVTVATDEGSMRVKAGFHMVGKPGAKRSFYAHEDSIWTVILATEKTDVEKIEKHFVAESEEEYMEHKKMLEDKT